MSKNKKKKKESKKTTKKKRSGIRFPARLLAPVGKFLSAKLKKLEKSKKEISSEDPFKDELRVSDNASPDTDAAEQDGHARTSALKNSLDRKIVQTRKALSRVKVGKYGICEECGKMIDTDRLMAFPETTICIKCEIKKEKKK